jgi:hypothetical protein
LNEDQGFGDAIKLMFIKAPVAKSMFTTIKDDFAVRVLDASKIKVAG